ncbi:hypothetical protein ACHQM5_011194 [Ranunculus cassubicifolius]
MPCAAIPPPPRATAIRDPKAVAWSALFKEDSATKGFTLLPNSSPSMVDGLYEVPEAVVQAGIHHWSEYSVGFFIDQRISFLTVRDALKKEWRLKNDFHMAADRDLFYFKFCNEEDRRSVMDRGPVFIAGRIFIVQPWSPEIEVKRQQINVVPIWVRIYEIPKQLWTTEGLGFLASLIGTPKFVDDLTAKEERLEFARVCVEIGVETKIEDIKKFRMNGKEEQVRLEYPWLPAVCTNCCRFGHLVEACQHKIGTVWCPKETANGAGSSRGMEEESNVFVDANESLVDPHVQKSGRIKTVVANKAKGKQRKGAKDGSSPPKD